MGAYTSEPESRFAYLRSHPSNVIETIETCSTGSFCTSLFLGDYNTNKHIYKIDLLNGGKTFYDGILKGTYTYTSLTSSSVYLFALNSNNLINSKTRIYNFKAFNGTEIKRNMVPCYKISDETIRGLYDMVTDTFYTNPVGTGTFEIGNNIVR